MLLGAAPAFANVDVWVERFKREARSQGVSPALLEEAFNGFAPNATVVKLDRKQPEGTLSFAEYQRKVLSPARVDRARDALSNHQSALQNVSARYGVNPQVIVALWGIESNFGDNQGNFEVVRSLATLAYEGRRAQYFRKELMNALKIVDAGHVGLNEMIGSWAGAMGQCQFMPSSFLAYAVDGDGDGRKDIWYSEADVFASIANYLTTIGWDATLPIIVRVNVPNSFDLKAHLGNDWRAFSGWQQLGVDAAPHPRLTDGTLLKLVRVGRGEGAEFGLATRNFDTLMHWNRSTYFVTAVSKLSDAL